MKYYRFLYGEAAGCLMHLGQIEDTKTEEHFSFLYLRGISGHVDRGRTEHTLFLCPDTIDLVVLGNADRKAAEVLKGLLSSVKIRTLILPKGAVCEALEKEGGQPRKIIRLAAGEKEPGWETTAAGWRVYAKSYHPGSVVMAHSLAETGTAGDRFEDCVMSVKTVAGTERCFREKMPDLYGCAVCCTQNRDFDVCRYKRKEGSCGYCTGTVLLPALAEEGTVPKWMKDLRSDMEGRIRGIRFIVLDGNTGAVPVWNDEAADAAGSEAAGYKRYFVGSASELSDRTIAEVSRSGRNHIPVLLKDGTAICCSGLLKYKEAQKA